MYTKSQMDQLGELVREQLKTGKMYFKDTGDGVISLIKVLPKDSVRLGNSRLDDMTWDAFIDLAIQNNIIT